ncbi:hypothetical protein EYZ11_012724 [Aspergillus tanneri]|uniref:Fungal lipase-type domain-containing protein n=1 Tax=Aspergillus tanneri TaxID=1220188 RepID=A0A4S3J1M3_9EURO|nr:hypothetical protein EYZ11_012724 [Aspergillus tanneri]
MALTFFSKVYLYTNSRLPSQLPPLQLQSKTNDPSYISADWRNGTKAMVIESLAIDDMNTIVIAIRGTQSFRDWAVNIKTDPTSPSDFLDDPFNLCHAGFLSVAKNMVHPVTVRLRHLLAENCRRASYSILITGHSAGGAQRPLYHVRGSPDITSASVLIRANVNVLFGR